MSLRLGIDTGGTFTDYVLYDSQSRRVSIGKVRSNPYDPSRPVVGLVQDLAADPATIDVLVYGTTVATNAILQRRGAPSGLITTRGFRDVLELRRRDRPNLFGLEGSFEPLIPRDRRVEIDERTRYDGSILRQPDPAEVGAAAQYLKSKGAEVVIVSLLHSYANPANERAIREILVAAGWPPDRIVLSSVLLPEWREFERTSTAVVGGYLMPLVADHVHSLQTGLRRAGCHADVFVVQSNGGLVAANLGEQFAVNMILSGPAAGVVAASSLGEAARYHDLITFDMGGTSCDVSLLVDGEPILREETRVEFGIPVRVPMVDVITIGAGGGSIAWVDPGGFLHVGPQSAGADPGPACYGRRGEAPTVTDANLVLGRIDSRFPIGALDEFDEEAAFSAIKTRVAQPLGLDVYRAAEAILQVVNARMTGALRQVSVERGHDPAEFDLLAYGGGGPLHAMQVARALAVRRTIVPQYPGVFSALGALLADVRHDFVRTVNWAWKSVDAVHLWAILDEQRAAGTQLLLAEGLDASQIEIVYAADIIYEGQTHTFRLEGLERGWSIADLKRQFMSQYLQRFRQLPPSATSLRLVNLRTHVRGVRPKIDLLALQNEPAQQQRNAINESHKLYFDGRMLEVPVIPRSALQPGRREQGPLVIQQVDTTIMVEPGGCAGLDDFGQIVLEG
ncbi:MAG TPA: hydantoin utilization protein A [Chloroflexi bacterium]|nr:hydantoin utilization protein A [Chloroflexota bacterium]